MKRLFFLLSLLFGLFIMAHAQTAEGQGGLAPVNPSQTASGPLPFTRPRAATPREASLSLSQSTMSYDTLGNRTQRVIAPAARFTKNQKVAYPLIMNYDFRIKKFIY
ncbi:MAG: hypothetical protein IJS07_02700 [Bacteroidales bacterium]|nr:hypothetical protein [Bacteroidales bacterium]